MTRILERSDVSPRALPKSDLPPGDVLYVCRCGLSRNQPFCDGSHKSTAGEALGGLYRYAVSNGELERRPIRIETL